MNHRLRCHLGCTRWYSEVLKPNYKLILVCLEIVLILTQDRCTVCAERTIGSETFWTHSMERLGDLGHVESCSVRLEMVLVLVQDRCTVCAK